MEGWKLSGNENRIDSLGTRTKKAEQKENLTMKVNIPKISIGFEVKWLISSSGKFQEIEEVYSQFSVRSVCTDG